MFHVHNPQGELIAVCVHAEDAGAVVGVYGEGAQIRSGDGKKVLWTEGSEPQPAGESFDFVATRCQLRIDGVL